MSKAGQPIEAAKGAIVASGLTRRFGARSALEAFELCIGPGGITGLLGPNGGGKSTFLRVLVGLVRPDSGAAWIDTVPLTGDGTAVRKRATFAPGEIALYGEWRARDLLAWLLRGRDPQALGRARALCDALVLPLERRLHAYSHGMKRQLLFAAALAPRVPVRILDEPTEGLDPTKRGTVLELLLEDARRGTTVLLSSHHLGEVDHACTRLVFLNQGRKIGDEDASSLQRRAARLLRLSYAGALPIAELEARLGPLCTRVETRLDAQSGHTRVSLELSCDDPREVLERLSRPGLAPLLTIDYGKLSLAELYRELYGVEGL